MINFFRKIRKQLADDNKPLKYMRYAIGEILLVVIGILIALQINNWNENSKSEANELKILLDLKKSIILDYPTLKMAIQGNQESIKSCNIILDALQEDKSYHDSLNFHFENAHLWWRGILNPSAYERAKTFGLDFIEDDDLREDLNFVYTMSHNFEITLNSREENYYYSTASPILTRLFKSTELALDANHIEGNHSPLDFVALKNEKNYRTILTTTIGNKKKLLTWLIFRLKSMEAIEEKLNVLINRLEKQ